MTIAPAMAMSITMTTTTIKIGVDDELSSDWLVVCCCCDLHVTPSTDSHTK